jgi:leucyl aminopeptidase
LWHAAGLVERLPVRRFRLAQEFTAEAATQLCLGFAYGGYRFDRYRPAKSELASVEAPPNADVQFVALASEALRMARDWINTPAGDLGPAELAAAARRPSVIKPSTRNGWARTCLPRIFPPFMQ